MLRVALFDLDETLYPAASGLWDAIAERIQAFMVERLGLDPARAVDLRHRYYDTFGTTLSGLQHDFHVQAEDYLAYVHDLPVEDYLRPDPALSGMLARLPLTKVIFTNADAPHARRVLDCLGVARHFPQIVDIHALGFVNKPDPRAYVTALDLVGAQAQECVYAEDSLRNLLPARALGMVTILVSNHGTAVGADYQVPSVHHVERIIAGLMGQVS